MKYYFANWKMYQSLESMQAFVDAWQQDKYMQNIVEQKYVGIAPSYEHLYLLRQNFANHKIHIGSQDCSTFLQGAYTGQVSIQALKELPVDFVIIGHSEVRHYLQQTDAMILSKCKLLLALNISPIICIGETLEQKNTGMTLPALCDQLEGILAYLQTYHGSTKIFIAYEPIYAIGTGIVPDIKDLQEVFYILQKLFEQVPVAKNIIFLYGGSVSSQSVMALQKIHEISGFLIGKASIDFQELKKIVESE